MTSAIATSGIIPNMTGTIEAAVLILHRKARRCDVNERTCDEPCEQHQRGPTMTMSAITIEMRRSVERSPRWIIDVRNAGTQRLVRRRGDHCNETDGNASSDEELVGVLSRTEPQAMLMSRIRPAITPAIAATPVRPD